MAKLDLALTLIFGTTSLLSLVAAALCFRKAMKVSGEKDGDLKMFVWTVGAMIGLIVAGMGAAYILLPIFFTYTQ